MKTDTIEYRVVEAYNHTKTREQKNIFNFPGMKIEN